MLCRGLTVLSTMLWSCRRLLLSEGIDPLQESCHIHQLVSVSVLQSTFEAQSWDFDALPKDSM